MADPLTAQPAETNNETNNGIDVYDISGKEPILGTVPHENVTEAVASGKYSLPSNTTIPVISPQGEHMTLDSSESEQAFQNGWKYATPTDIAEHKYGSTSQQVIAGLEGAAQGVAGPLAPMAEEALGVDPEGIRGRQAANPITHGVGEGIGLLGGIATGGAEARLATGAAKELAGYSMGALAEKAGLAGAKALGLGEVTTAAKIGSTAAKAAIENMVISSGDEVSRMVLQDPEQTIETAIPDIGLSGLIGGGLGAAVGSVSPLWKATMAKATGGVLEGIAKKLGGIENVIPDHVEEAIRRANITDDIAPEIKASMINNPHIQQKAQILMDSATDSGVKYQAALKDFKNTVSTHMAEALGKSPEDIAALENLNNHDIGERIKRHIQNTLETRYEPIAKNYEAISKKFKDVPLQSYVKGNLTDKIAQVVSTGASQESAEAKLVQRVLKEIPHLENLEQLRNYTSSLGRETSGIAKQELWEVGSKLRSALNDAEEQSLNYVVSQKAPELLQQHLDTNKAYKALKSTIGDLNDRLRVGPHGGVKTFLSALNDMDGEAVLNRLNPSGKASIITELGDKFPEVAKQVKDYHLSKLLKTASKFVQPGEIVNPNTLMKEIAKLSPQMRDFIIPKKAAVQLDALHTLLEQLPQKIGKSGTPQGLDGLLSRVPSTVAGVGAMLTGHNIVTAGLIGMLTKALGRDAPDAVRLSLLKFLGSDKHIEPTAFKAMVDYVQATIKGENLVAKATKNVFNATKEVLPQSLIPSEKDRNNLDKQLKALHKDPSPLLNTGGHTSHYLPEHGEKMAQTAAQAVNYLNSLRPNTDKQAPLDTKPVVNAVQQSKYNQALNIAQQPLLVLHKIQSGTIIPQDVIALKTMYPSLYNKFNQQLTSHITEMVHNGENIPYKTRLGLSIFMMQPLDSTMLPSSIMAAQMVSSPQKGGENQQQSPQKPPAASSVKGLSKMPQSYQTPGQAREAERSSGK